MKQGALAALVLLFASTACSKKKEPKAAPPPTQSAVIDASAAPSGVARVVQAQTMVLRQVLVEVNEPAKAYALDSKELAKGLGAQLLASGWLAAREGQVPEDHAARRVEAMLNISYDVTAPAGDTPGRLVVAMEATLEFIDDRGELQPRVAIIVEDALGAKDEASIAKELNALARAALETVGESLVARERLRRASHAELLSQLSLGGDDSGMKIWGLELAAERALREAVPAGIAALAHEDENVRAAAIAMLVSLRDPRAMSALSKDIDFKDYEQLRVVMEAASAIGGEDAVEFLEFVASGHPDEDIRARAKENLVQARRQ